VCVALSIPHVDTLLPLHHPPTPRVSTLSLHDALPIFRRLALPDIELALDAGIGRVDPAVAVVVVLVVVVLQRQFGAVIWAELESGGLEIEEKLDGIDGFHGDQDRVARLKRRPVGPAQQAVARYLESEHLVAADPRARPLVIHAHFPVLTYPGVE